MQLKRKIGVALATLGIMAGAITAVAPNALAATETKTSWSECGSLPAKLHIDIKVVKDLVNNNRHVYVRGYGVGYNGYKYQVVGPSIWQFEGLIYYRHTAMDVNTWYGKLVTGLDWRSINWDARIFSGSRYCDAFLPH
jgi:hypothetical protein